MHAGWQKIYGYQTHRYNITHCSLSCKNYRYDVNLFGAFVRDYSFINNVNQSTTNSLLIYPARSSNTDKLWRSLLHIHVPIPVIVKCEYNIFYRYYYTRLTVECQRVTIAFRCFVSLFLCNQREGTAERRRLKIILNSHSTSTEWRKKECCGCRFNSETSSRWILWIAEIKYHSFCPISPIWKRIEVVSITEARVKEHPFIFYKLVFHSLFHFPTKSRLSCKSNSV